MKAGAQDYLVKDRITAEGLGLAIRKATQKVSLLRALQAERDHLARSLAEKEVLLQEVHHRVKNNLQVIASLLRLQADAFGDQAFAPASLHESQQRVESMAMIHEQLYESADLHRVDVAKHAGLVLSNLLHAYGADPARISGRVALEPGSLMLGVDQAIPAGLILNELISNALKHGFPEGRSGSIAVEVGWRAGSVLLEVRDTGVGLPVNFLLNRTKSLGLRIVQILARQLKGTCEAESVAGATFRVSFPGVSNEAR